MSPVGCFCGGEWRALICWFLWVIAARSAGVTPVPRTVPVPVILAESDRSELEQGVNVLGEAIAALRSSPGAAWLPDVQIFQRAVSVALQHHEFYRTNEVALARMLLQEGQQRALELREGRPSWLRATGLVVRGYVSKVDGSVQPYGLVVPADAFHPPDRSRWLEVWLHGRDDTLTELKFLAERQRSPGEFTPADTLVLHPYGRDCNAFKFAGEVDVFEALEHVQRNYAVDDRRVALRGFSMGGAGTWHLAAHYPDSWVVAAPGAGFAETADYLQLRSGQALPSVWEQTLWQLYDAPDYAANFRNLPVVAYHGTLDPQQQAAEIMARALNGEGLLLPRVWGTNVGHKYTPEAKRELNDFVAAAVATGREQQPDQVHFTTRTLRYSRGVGLELLGLNQHWVRADIDLERSQRRIRTTNVTSFRIDAMADGRWDIDGQRCVVAHGGTSLTQPERSTTWRRNRRGQWVVVRDAIEPEIGRKVPGLQGPIDDAFMAGFLVVRPTGKSRNPLTAAWVAQSLALATNDWRAQFRGEARVKDDVQVTADDLAKYNLILWGDPRSNQWIGRLADRLPIRWNDREVRVGPRRFASAQHLPVFICPNPLNPRRYVVLNSGFTFARVLPASNAQQTPKLPDYAVLDLAHDDAVVCADFFDESWRVKR